MLDILTLLFRFTMRSRMLFNPFVAVVRMSISQERPASFTTGGSSARLSWEALGTSAIVELSEGGPFAHSLTHRSQLKGWLCN
jgi:hypothetical protein